MDQLMPTGVIGSITVLKFARENDTTLTGEELIEEKVNPDNWIDDTGHSENIDQKRVRNDPYRTDIDVIERGLSPQKLAILKALVDTNDLNIKELETKSGVPENTLRGDIRKELRNDGLIDISVEDVVSPNTRNVAFRSLNADGLALLENEAQLNQLPPKQRDLIALIGNGEVSDDFLANHFQIAKPSVRKKIGTVSRYIETARREMQVDTTVQMNIFSITNDGIDAIAGL